MTQKELICADEKDENQVCKWQAAGGKSTYAAQPATDSALTLTSRNQRVRKSVESETRRFSVF
jgi:hypothetical protein